MRKQYYARIGFIRGDNGYRRLVLVGSFNYVSKRRPGGTVIITNLDLEESINSSSIYSRYLEAWWNSHLNISGFGTRASRWVRDHEVCDTNS